LRGQGGKAGKSPGRQKTQKTFIAEDAKEGAGHYSISGKNREEKTGVHRSEKEPLVKANCADEREKKGVRTKLKKRKSGKERS